MELCLQFWRGHTKQPQLFSMDLFFHFRSITKGNILWACPLIGSCRLRELIGNLLAMGSRISPLSSPFWHSTPWLSLSLKMIEANLLDPWTGIESLFCLRYKQKNEFYLISPFVRLKEKEEVCLGQYLISDFRGMSHPVKIRVLQSLDHKTGASL